MGTHWSRSKIIDCGRWLRGTLADGPLPSQCMRDAAAKAGFQHKTVAHARQRNDIEIMRIGFGGTGQQTWWRIKGDHRPPVLSAQAEDRLITCDRGHSYEINTGVLPRPCVLPNCDGIARIPTNTETRQPQTPSAGSVIFVTDQAIWRPIAWRGSPFRRSR